MIPTLLLHIQVSVILQFSAKCTYLHVCSLYLHTLKSLLNEYTRLDNAIYFPPYSEVFPYTRLPILMKYFYTRLLDYTCLTFQSM